MRLINYPAKHSKYLSAEHQVPIPVATQSNAWICGHSLPGIEGSNPNGSVDVRLL